jgi:alkylation response protein AidB-like acyl-CoA dehydrogenase
MTTDFSDLHDDLRAVARDLLGTAGPESGIGWRAIAGSGWPGLEAPSALDGAGATFAEVAVVLQEMGRAATRSPYLGAAVLGVGALNLLEPGPDRDRLLAETASGATVPCVTLPGEEHTTPFRIEQTPDGLRLHGRASFVPYAPGADRLLLPALDPAGTPVVVNLPSQAPGLTLTPQPVLDETRSLALVTADGTEINEASIWRFNGDPASAIRCLHDRAATALACDSLGLSEAMLDATVTYAGVREQFGRPIGSFQAVKHACADMLVQISVSRGLVAAAVRDLAEDTPDASVSTSMAKSHTCAAAVDIAGKAMQLHGGMGYTWESGIHVYLKRATLNRSLFGSPTVHRKRLSARYR